MKNYAARVGKGIALLLTLAAFTGTAFADDGHGNGAPANAGTGAPAAQGNGPNATPPGQAKKEATPPAAAPAAPAPPAPAQPAAKAEHKAGAPVASDGSKKYGNGHSALEIAKKSAPNLTLNDLSEPGKSGKHKVTICHKTGSGYVVITVDVHALKNGHTTAKGDIIPAPAGGCPAAAATTAAQAAEQRTESNCAATTTTTTTVAGVRHATGSKSHPFVEKLLTNPKSAHFDSSKHPDDQKVAATVVTVTPTNANCSHTAATQAANGTAAQSATAATQSATAATQPATVAPATQASGTAPASASAGSVLGAQATLGNGKPLAKAAKKASAGGVLGATTKLGQSIRGGHLPFTGLPLWIALLVAAGLIGTGLVVRRTGRTTA